MEDYQAAVQVPDKIWYLLLRLDTSVTLYSVSKIIHHFHVSIGMRTSSRRRAAICTLLATHVQMENIKNLPAGVFSVLYSAQICFPDECIPQDIV
jgi:hypothetical protein